MDPTKQHPHGVELGSSPLPIRADEVMKCLYGLFGRLDDVDSNSFVPFLCLVVCFTGLIVTV